MESKMNYFLKIKHWQLFLLLACTYLAFQIAGTTTVISSQDTIKKMSERTYFIFKTSTVISTQEITKEGAESLTVIPSQNITVKISKYSPLVILFYLVLCGWFYSVVVNLNKKTPDTVMMNLTKFKCLFFIPIICAFLGYILSYFFLFNFVSNGGQVNLAAFIPIIIIFVLFQMFCSFYCIYFASKSLKTVELQRTVTFKDYVAEFFLFLFFPIGVWFIQPKINKIFNETL
jgi:hypothetical protein